jgi:hypothetical protein
MLNRRLLAFLVLALTETAIQAQPVAPPAPKEYQVLIRYRIQAGVQERVRQFYPMLEFIHALGFKPNPGFDADDEAGNATHNRLTGRMPSATARRLLEEPHVKSILLLPPGFALPDVENAEAPVKVRIELAGGLSPTQQRLLSEQVRERLREFGFKEAIAYDHRRFTRLVGTVRGGELETLLKDIRGEPSGWLAPLQPLNELPVPFREVSPIRVTEVIPEPEGVQPLRELPPPPELPKGMEHLEKIASDLRALAGKEGDAGKPVRVEIILAATPGNESTTWQRELIATVPQLIVEGRYGPIVTAVVAPDKTPALAASPLVSTIRLPRSGAPILIPPVDAKGRNREALSASGLARLHRLGHQGKGVRIGVIAGDFRGWEALVKSKQLPAATRLLDLTIQRNSSIDPEPYPDDGQLVGHGAQCAQAVALAAPQADLLLIRVDPAAPHQLLAIARDINGEPLRNETMVQRRDDLEAAGEQLQFRWKQVLTERREILEDFAATEEAQQRRLAHFQKVQDLKDDEAVYDKRLGRFLQHQRDLRELARMQVVVNTLGWQEGHAPDGSSPLARYLTERPFRSTWWFQPAGDIRGQTWTGLFRDADGNRVMEFVTGSAPVPKGRWTPELNFLAWQPWTGKQEPELPGKATLRVWLLWREAHEPEFLQRGEDLYREPLARIRLQLLRQRDPAGTKLATDDMELVAQSSGLPQRIDNEPSYSTYQQLLEYVVENPGAFALRVEGRAPEEIRPPDTPTLPAVRKQFDLRLRLFVEVGDPDSRAAGRPIFLDYPTTEGAIGMPGDSRSVFTIGAADRTGQQQLYSSAGPPLNLELLGKPNFLSFDGLEVGPGEGARGVPGSSIAASFAAGLTATALSAGVPPGAFLTPQPPRPGGPLRIPDAAPVSARKGT